MKGKQGLSEIIKAVAGNMLADTHVALPGKVVKYDATKQKADIKPLIKKQYRDGKIDPLSVIPNVPVIFPRSGNAFLTFPVAKGDGVLIVFSERSLDKWLSIGGDVSPEDRRKHDLSDAIAIPGLRPFNAGGADANDVVLVANEGGSEIEFRLKKNGETVLKSPVKVTIDTPETVFTGNVQVDGTIDADGTITSLANIVATALMQGATLTITGAGSIAGKDFATHTHSQGNDSADNSQVETDGVT